MHLCQLRGKAVVAAAAALVTMAALSGCTAAQNTSDSACKPSKGDVNLDYWTWGDGYDKVTALWNKTHPKIHVKMSSLPGGNSGGYQKMSNAIEAGTSPDVEFIEFDTLNQFKLQNGLADVSKCLTSKQLADYVPSILQQVRLGDDKAVYGLPANSGPMALYYRADLFKQHGISIPTTWDEFAADAAKIKAIDPSAYITNFSPTSGNWFAALASQAGAKWFEVTKKDWKVDLDDPASKKVADYWQGLIDKGEVSTAADNSPEWASEIAGSHMWSWVSAAWGAGVIKANAPDTSGKWAVAPMPRWDDGFGATTWGGGALTVTPGSKHPYEAAQFAYWVTTDPGALKILRAAIGVYPTSKTLLAGAEFQQADPFFGGQKIFNVLGEATDSLPNVTWGPSMAATYGAVSDAFGANLKDLSGDLTTAQGRVVDDLKRQGIPVDK